MIEMGRLLCLIIAGFMAFAPLQLAALTSVGAGGLPSATDYGASLLPEMSGVVSWRTLALVEPVRHGGRFVPEFSKEVLALDSRLVRVIGFMMPLDMTNGQQHFLLSAVPASCPYCMPAGPEAIVEVLSKHPVKFGFEPVIMAGKLSILKNDKSGMFYRMTDNELVAMPAK